MEEAVRKKRRAFLISAGFAVSVLIGGFYKPLFVFAEQDDFLIEPLYHEVEIRGADVEQSFYVDLSNRTGADAVFSVSVVDFGTLDESGGIAFLGGSGDFERRYGLASWMKVGSESFIVPAGKSERIPITVENKESLSPGGHYGAVLFRMAGSGDMTTDSPTVAVESSFAALVFVKKTGGEIAELSYKGSEDISRDVFGIPAGFPLQFQNSGNIHLVPRGRVVVTDPFGRVVRKGTINAESGRILPESFRAFQAELKPLSYAFFPGLYTVTVEYRYDGKESFDTVSERVFPIPLAAIWIGGGVLLIVCIYWVARKSSDKRKERKNETE
ncbi:MAG: hypothetical protein KBD19_04025 [Candidatus Moranbacteria bacterium]|jgi:hypothetical protein|nr:hypothetical protein [Candidatus Moranbacteria bacterium]